MALGNVARFTYIFPGKFGMSTKKIIIIIMRSRVVTLNQNILT